MEIAGFVCQNISMSNLGVEPTELTLILTTPQRCDLLDGCYTNSDETNVHFYRFLDHFMQMDI